VKLLNELVEAADERVLFRVGGRYGRLLNSSGRYLKTNPVTAE
jgi:hypothetical protein